MEPLKPLADSERWDYYDRELKRAHGDMFARPVALVAKHTGAVLATYPSLEAAYAALPDVPQSTKANACLGWA